MNLRALVISLGFLLVVGGGVYLLTAGSHESPITNFEECVQAGNPVMESYPRQCATKDGKHFTEDVSVVSQKDDLIRVTRPHPNETLASPFTVSGEARGTWHGGNQTIVAGADYRHSRHQCSNW